MMKGKAIALLLLLGLAAFAAPSRAETVEEDEYEDVSDSAFLVVRRKLSDDKPQVGKEITVSVELYNAGDSPATDVTAVDEAWDPNVFRTEGKLDASFKSIAAGATKSFSYTITPKFSFEMFEQRPVLVTYVAEKGGKPITTNSHPLFIRAFSSTELLKSKALDIGGTVTLGILSTERDWMRFIVIGGGALVAYLLLGAARAMSKARDDSRRKSALRALGVADDFKTK